ncbi:hypothetical protein WJX72_012011 [[Myrmecia] bisecta]|uniref:Peptidase M14 domain-containing protein n=1 Tax=[Myrmecia] bisecta TaxID=41462 RepID=A0AAW1PPW4_9CHLO
MTATSPPSRVAAFCCLVASIVTAHADIPWDTYHKTADLLETLKASADKLPSLVKYEEVVDPESDSTLPLFTVTDFPSGTESKELILLVGGEHARELITSEIAFWLIQLLAQQAPGLESWPAASQVQQLGKSAPLGKWGAALLKKCVFKVLPVVNIAGRKAVEAGNTCLRKTLSGVDLNRNWPYRWVPQNDEKADEYGGAAALSEPEARIIKHIAETHRPQAYVTMHSGEYALYVPWDSEKAVAPNLPEGVDDLLDKMNVYCQCMHGSGGEVAGYLAFGTSMDYMYSELFVPYPLTVEVYGPDGLGTLEKGGHPRRLLASSGQPDSPLGGSDKCFTDYNPPTQEEYQKVVFTWIGALLAFAGHISPAPEGQGAEDGPQQPVGNARSVGAEEPSGDMATGGAKVEDVHGDAEREQHEVSKEAEAAVMPQLSAPVLIAIALLASCCFGVWLKIGRPTPWGMRRKSPSQSVTRRPHSQPRYQQV